MFVRIGNYLADITGKAIKRHGNQIMITQQKPEAGVTGGSIVAITTFDSETQAETQFENLCEWLEKADTNSSCLFTLQK